jgi:hypothetical protein
MILAALELEVRPFSQEFAVRYPKAVETLTKDPDQLLTFFRNWSI